MDKGGHKQEATQSSYRESDPLDLADKTPTPTPTPPGTVTSTPLVGRADGGCKAFSNGLGEGIGQGVTQEQVQGKQ